MDKTLCIDNDRDNIINTAKQKFKNNYSLRDYIHNDVTSGINAI